MAVIKTWTNGWTTTDRMNEDDMLDCIFGCDGDDTLCHYLRCDILWTLIYAFTGCSLTNLSASPESRACFVDLSLWSVVNCWVAFQAYHAIKLHYRALIDEAEDCGDYREVQSVACELIEGLVDIAADDGLSINYSVGSAQNIPNSSNSNHPNIPNPNYLNSTNSSNSQFFNT